MIAEEKKLETLEKLRPIDDVLFEMLSRNPKVCEEILQTVQLDKGICVSHTTTQSTLRNFMAKSVILDTLCFRDDKPNSIGNIEVQRANNDNHLQRARYNGSMITTRFTASGTDYNDVPDVSVLYISEKDFLHQGLTTYHVGKTVKENGNIVDDGFAEVFVNAEIDDGSMTAELMKCFKKTMVDDDRFPELSREMKRLKTTKEGRQSMCKVIDELFESEKKILRAEYAAEYEAELASKDEALASKDEEIASYKAYIAELLSKLPPA